MSESTKSLSKGVYKHQPIFKLECGKQLESLEIAYTTYGKLNSDCSNVIWVCHALTANANPSEWWSGLVGEGQLFDPDTHYIVCANIIGSPYGSTNALDINPATKQIWGIDFPLITVRDNVNAFIHLRKHLGIDRIHTIIGGSLGGHHAMEWAICEPKTIQHLVLCATSAKLSPWAIAFNESQRMAIKVDPQWPKNPQLEGLKVARSIALLSYRQASGYNQTQQDTFDFNRPLKAQTYQQYQGEKLSKRFNAFSYYGLTKTMDSHDVGRSRTSIEQSLATISAKTLVVGIHTDQLFSIEESERLAQHIPGAQLKLINSIFGHDGFLLENEQLSALINAFYRGHLKPVKKKNIALIGYGCVGTGFHQLSSSTENNTAINQIIVKDINKKRCIETDLLSDQLDTCINNPDNHLIVETINDDEKAFVIVKRSLENNKDVISASKGMIADNLAELLQLQKKHQKTVLYEAAVGGSIPIVQQLTDYFNIESNQSITGILNGSSNYILSAMFNQGSSYNNALQEAQQLGFAETDTSHDVEGIDAKHKAIILALHGFGIVTKKDQIINLGIQKIQSKDIKFAKKHGLVIKQIVKIMKNNNQVAISVLPEFISQHSELGQTEAENNAVIIRNNNVDYIFKGKGAGSIPTGMAVVADVKLIEKGYSYHYQLNPNIQLNNEGTCHVYISKNMSCMPLIHGTVLYNNADYMILKTTAEQLLLHQNYLQNNHFVAQIDLDLYEKKCHY